MGRSPLDPRSGEEVPPLRTPSLVVSRLEGGSSFPLTGLRPTQRKAPRRAAHHLGGWGTLSFSLWGGRKRRKQKNENTRRRTCSLLLGVRSRRVRTIGASRPIGGRLALGAWRCEGRRPVTPPEHLPFPFLQTREGEREGRNLLPSPPGSRGRSPWCSFLRFLQRKRTRAGALRSRVSPSTAALRRKTARQPLALLSSLRLALFPERRGLPPKKTRGGKMLGKGPLFPHPASDNLFCARWV